jgi:hypothetical protein
MGDSLENPCRGEDAHLDFFRESDYRAGAWEKASRAKSREKPSVHTEILPTLSLPRETERDEKALATIPIFPAILADFYGSRSFNGCHGSFSGLGGGFDQTGSR